MECPILFWLLRWMPCGELYWYCVVDFLCHVMFKIENVGGLSIGFYRCNQAAQIIEDCNEYRPIETWPVLINGVTEALDSVSLDKETGFQESKKTVNCAEPWKWTNGKKKDMKNKKAHHVYYTYNKRWSSCDRDSSSFEESSDHHNLKRYPDVQNITIKAPSPCCIYELSEGQIDLMNGFKECTIRHKTETMEQVLPLIAKSKRIISCCLDIAIEVSLCLSHPEIGNLRIKYEALYDHGQPQLWEYLRIIPRGFTRWCQMEANMCTAICSTNSAESRHDFEQQMQGCAFEMAPRHAHKGPIVVVKFVVSFLKPWLCFRLDHWIHCQRNFTSRGENC